MHRRRARNAHFRRHAGVGFEKFEMIDHRMMREAELAMDANAARLGLHALKLDAVIELVDLDAGEHAVEIEVPPGTAEFAVGRELETDLFLLPDDLLDLAVFDLGELRRADLARLPLRPRVFQWCGPQ